MLLAVTIFYLLEVITERIVYLDKSILMHSQTWKRLAFT